jgi:hypothetical protein
MAESSVSSLRHEFPALALALTFIPHRHRSIYSDLFLLWLEGRRATHANEAMIAAVRLAWWRDAIANQASQSVPLADRLLALKATHPDILLAITDTLNQMISLLTGGAPKAEALAVWHHMMANQLNTYADQANGNNLDNQEEATILHVLDQSLLGKGGIDQHTYSGKHMLFRLISWLTQDPARLYYPNQRPMLALKMTMAVLFRNI